jgi:hypothetical protein
LSRDSKFKLKELQPTRKINVIASAIRPRLELRAKGHFLRADSVFALMQTLGRSVVASPSARAKGADHTTVWGESQEQ